MALLDQSPDGDRDNLSSDALFARKWAGRMAIPLLIVASVFSWGLMPFNPPDQVREGEVLALFLLLALYAAILVNRKLKAHSELEPLVRAVAAATIVLGSIAVVFAAIFFASMFMYSVHPHR